MNRTLLPLPLALLLAFALASCGEPHEEGEEHNNSTQNNAENNNSNSSANNPNSSNNQDNNANNSNNAASNNANNANNGTSNNGEPCPAPNACGGCEPLSDDLGAPCGPCLDGALACESTDALTCTGASPLNPCGGCTPLPGQPGESCGSCDDGTLACEGTDALACTGATTDCLDEALHCDDDLDNDGDGLTDCDDEQCEHHASCTPPTELCDNSTDDDSNGLADCDDPACTAHDACLDWACVDIDLGSQLGRPLHTLQQLDDTNDLRNDCLTDAPDTVFRWTAPHDGLFTFDTTHMNGELNVLQVSTQGACRPDTAFCGLGYDLPAFGRTRQWRSNVSLHLQQGQSVLIVTEESTRLGITANLLPQASAAIWIPLIYSHHSMRTTADFSGDGHPEVWVYHQDGAAQLFIFSEDSLDSMIHGRLWSYRRLIVGPGWGPWQSPNTYDFDVDGDGYYDLWYAHASDELSNESSWTTVHHGTPGGVMSSWPGEVFPFWRPVLAGGDLTGDGVPDLVTTDPIEQQIDVYDDVQQALLAGGEPLVRFERRADISIPSSLAVCDVTGDGFNDLLTSQGALVFPGPLSAQSTTVPPLMLGSPPADRYSGLLVTDLNQDGVCDIIFSREGNHRSADQLQRWGDVMVFYGPLNQPYSPEDANLRFEAEESDALWNFGKSKIVGDFNGDGRPDIAVSAPRALGLPTMEPTDSAGGLVLVFFAPFDAQTSIPARSADRTIATYGTYHQQGSPFTPTFGTLLASDDLNGDGYDDLIISDGNYESLTVMSGFHMTHESFGEEFHP